MKHRNSNGANLGFEKRLWGMADKLRVYIDASEYKYMILGRIFLKYASDVFQAKYKQLGAAKETEYTDPEDRDEYATVNIFRVPKVARRDKLQASAKQPTIDKLVDDDRIAIEKKNPKLKGVLSNDYAWIHHFIPHLSPTGAGFVTANGSMSTSTAGVSEIRRNIIEADLVDCVIAMPGQLFYTTQMPVCLRSVARDKKNGRFRDMRGRTRFIDTRTMENLIGRAHRKLSDMGIGRIAGIYHAWRGEEGAGEYEDMPGFCKSSITDEIRDHGFARTPGRYMGAAEASDDGEPFDEKMGGLTTELLDGFLSRMSLRRQLKNLLDFGFGGK